MRDRDHEWLLARERGERVVDVPASELARYERLTAHLADLDDPVPPAGWEERLLARLDAPSPPRRRAARAAVASALVLAAVAAAAWWLWPSHGRPAPAVSLELRRGSVVHRGDEGSIGDTLVVRGDLPERFDLRTYDEAGVLLARCGPDGGCASMGPPVVWEIALTSPGLVRVILITGDAVPPPLGRLDDDLAAASRAGAQIVQLREVTVR
ncbi:MAG: hypothetical protein KF773_26020 [Deltaproteobacteria bacterium]|nr:hypothetical protein [Deltaproteobacteria bacterium]